MCMISAKKSYLKIIPSCIKKAILLDFTEEHTKIYNDLVMKVRNNILMEEWNDISHVEYLNPKGLQEFLAAQINLENI